MGLANADVTILVISMLFLLAKGEPAHEGVVHNFTSGSSSSSAWLRKVTNHPRPRPPGCWSRPWICKRGENNPPRTRMRCCRNQCVDVFSDIYNCGSCGKTCPLTWHCCRGFCVNTNISPFNCGRCGNKCPWGVQCDHGMCGYGQPFPFPTPWPRPPFPLPPKQPKPWPPHHPHPPKGNQPPAMSQTP